MATLSEPDRLPDDESADLFDRVERFRAAWKADGSGGMARYLPPPGARHRAAVLVQIAVADMERRATAGLPFRVETYVTRFPKDLSGDTPPVALLVAEYRLRLQFTDKPELDEYKDRFPARFADFTRGLEPPGGSAEQSTRPSIVLPLTPARPTVPDIADIADLANLPRPAGSALIPPPAPRPDPVNSTRVSDRTPGGTDGPRKSTLVDSRPAPNPRGSKIGDLVATNGGDIDTTPVRHLSGGASTILPADAPYELLRKLGEGAFGEVFEALAPGGIRVAVKRISRNSNHPASRAEQDALEVVKNLSHPFLLKTQAYWVFDDRLVIVMELADGSLADRVEKFQAQGRMGVPPEDLIPLFEQAAKALDYLHSQNVSHRDIKPENVLILKDHAKVADFGLARPQEHTLTMVGQTVGTPAYMAPEMWQQKVSIHSDQYSLAATYVRCRLGRNLFDTTVLIEMASFHIHETPDLAPLSAAEQGVLLRALAKNPDDRFPSCGEFAAALRAAVLSPAMGTGGSGFGLQGSAIKAALESTAPPPKPGALRAVLPMAAVGLACVITIVVALKLMIPPPVPPTGPAADAKDKGGTTAPPPPEAEKRYARVPGWEPLTTDKAVKIGDKFYPRVLTRAVAGETLEAVLVFAGKESDPENPFYILRNKVTNRVFAPTLAQALTSQPAVVDHLRQYIKPFPAGAWKAGAVTGDGRKLGIDDEQAGVPVLGVTLPEALLAARELGGRLPTFVEWRRAAGFGQDSRPSPAGELLVVPKDQQDPDDPSKEGDWKRGELKRRNLALGLDDGPRPVDKLTADVSKPWGIHQLVSNGREWLGEYDGGGRLIALEDDLSGGKKAARVIGHGAHETLIFRLTELTPGDQDWTETKATANGFRIVLIPK